MLQFTLTDAGQILINNATEGTNPVLVDSVVLYNGSTVLVTITDFIGNVVKDDSGLGDNIVIDFDDRSSSAYTITSFKLKSGTTDLAISEDVSIVKASNKQLKMRLTAQFEGASKCSFTHTSIGLPYATKFRQGLIRLTSSEDYPTQEHPERERQLQTTVLSARDTISKIEEYIHGTDQYVPWDVNVSDQSIQGSVHLEDIYLVDDYDSPTTNVLITLNGKTGNVDNISVDGHITGTAVVSSPTVSNGEVTDTAKLVNGSYIAAIYSNSVDVASTETYGHKLVTSHAVRDYVTTKLDGNSNNYVHKLGDETIAGNKTFSNNVIVNGTISGTAVQSDYKNSSQVVIWDDSGNYSKLPTVEVVHDALADLTTAYTTADSSLQTQIDALNAGQNLADIVDDVSHLVSHSVANLQPGDGSTTVGDKIQVLHDTNDNSTVYELRTGSASAATDHDSSTPNYYWHYIGEYGNDAYSKADADTTFVKIANLKDDTFIASSSASATTAPSTLGVKNYVTSVASNYVKLSSSSAQSITSPITITGATTINGNDLGLSSGTYTVKSTRSGNNYQVKGTANTAEFNLLNSSSNVVWGISLDSSEDATIIKRGSSQAISIKPIITSSSVTGYNVTGEAVADYSDIPSPDTPQSVTNGKLVTVDYLNWHTGSMSAYARLAGDNSFTGNNTFTNAGSVTFAGPVTLNGTISGTTIYSTYTKGTGTGGWSASESASKIPTVGTTNSAIEDAKKDVLNTISTSDTVGCVGLFIYTENSNSTPHKSGYTPSGAEKGIGTEIPGAYLKPVGMSLPMSGQISYKAVSPAMTGTWKLLSVALKRTATEPCLVMAQKVSTEN